MRIGDGFASLAALEKRIHHLANNGAGANDGDLHHDVVEPFRAQARQTRHLRAAFDLKHPDRVGFLQC